jgi:predicted nucleic acid-binding protein
MSVVKAFFDTNILIYLYGGGDPEKQAKAAELFSSQTRSGRAVVSTQVVQEFYAVATRKLGMARDVAGRVVRALLNLPLVIIDADLLLAALAMEERYRISFWDVLIVSAAEAAGAQVLYTEDLNDGQQYGQVTVRNPFRHAVTRQA